MYTTICDSKCQTTQCSFSKILYIGGAFFFFLREMVNTLISGLSFKEMSNRQEMRRKLPFHIPQKSQWSVQLKECCQLVYVADLTYYCGTVWLC